MKYLAGCLVLRRPRATISLPARRDLSYQVDFTSIERQAYETVRERAIARIDEALQSGSEVSKGSAYVNVLQQIEALRLICNMGLHYRLRHNKTENSGGATAEWTATAQQTFNAQREMDTITCLQCATSLTLTETLSDDVTASDGLPCFFRCLRFYCSQCISQKGHRDRHVSCGHSPSCPGAFVSISDGALEELPSLDGLKATPNMILPSSLLPSKVQALVADIRNQPEGVKW